MQKQQKSIHRERIPVTEVAYTHNTNPWILWVSAFQVIVLHNYAPKEVSFSPVADQCAEFLHEEAEELNDAVKARDMYGTIDALVDTIYYALGMAHQMGVDLTPFFYEVHLANMEKEHDPTAVPGVNKRVIKPEGWQPPRIAEVLRELQK